MYRKKPLALFSNSLLGALQEPTLLDFGGANLAEKLGKPANSFSVVGPIASYFSKRYGFNEKALIVAFSGDNPCSFVGLRLKENQIGVSLGTSDTIFGATRTLSPSAVEGHVFCDPGDSKGLMVLLCFKNGSLTREHVRNESAKGSWEEFNAALRASPAGNGGKIGMYFVEPEITPPAKPGTYRFVADGSLLGSAQQFSPAEEVRAVVEGQCLAMLLHSRKLGLSVNSIIATGATAFSSPPSPTRPLTVGLVTGGASTNSAIVQVLSDVFGAPVSVGDVPNSAALGGAFKAFHGWFVSGGESILRSKPLVEVIEPFVAGFQMQVAATPNPQNHRAYSAMADRYAALEQLHVKTL